MFTRPVCSTTVGFAIVYLLSNSAQAGMPSPQLIVTELGKRRLEEISFFLVGFLLLTAFCRWLWNGLGKDLTILPRLSYRGALFLMLLWGLALTVVLSLVSGARELMTPAAWEPNGITHRLANSRSVSATADLSGRRLRLESLKRELWEYSAAHDSQFPNEINQLAPEVAVADTISGLRFFIQPNLRTTSPRTVLVSEPDIYPQRLLLLTDGAIVIEERRGEGTP